ncbi:MAG TPA: hypothetical protein VF950_02930 [Planctomycetota bacterium]
MTWIALLAATQDVPSRWDFKPGSWVEMNWTSLRAKDAVRRAYREDIPPSGPKPAAFLDGLQEVSRRKEDWRGRPCEAIEYKDETRHATLWIVEGVAIPARDMATGGRWVAVPSDAVRALRVEKKASATFTSKLDVLELSAPIEAAGRRFDCVLESTSSTYERPESTILRANRRWLSAEIPGHVVRQDRQCTDNPAAVPHDYSTRAELKAFHVAR